MKQSEFKRWLAAQGCTFENGTKHTKVYLGESEVRCPGIRGTRLAKACVWPS